MPSHQAKLAYYKALRAEAHRTCETLSKTYGRVVVGFPLSVGADLGMSGKKKHKDPLLERRRNPGKDDGYTFNSDAYLPAKDTIGEDQYDEDTYYGYDHMGRYLAGNFENEGEQPTGADGVWKPRVMVSLLDLAKPAKPRGLMKDFTVVPNVPRVLAIDDFQTDPDWESWGDEDYDAWVDVPNLNRKSYASAVSKG